MDRRIAELCAQRTPGTELKATINQEMGLNWTFAAYWRRVRKAGHSWPPDQDRPPRSISWIADGNGMLHASLACAGCGKNFEASPSHPQQKFCSVKCYQKAWNACNHPRKQPELKACAQCSRAFETSDPQKKFCSEKCRNRDHYLRHRPRYKTYTKKYRAEHPEKARLACRRYFAKHRAAQNANTRARYAEKKRPADWNDQSTDDRTIGTELLSRPGYMSNQELGERLDAARTLTCPYAENWVTALSRPGRAANYISDIRKWVNRPGKTPSKKSASITFSVIR